MTLTSAPPRGPERARAARDLQPAGRIRTLVRLVRTQFRTWVPHRRSRNLLGTMPVFAGCSRRQLFRLARWGDVIEVQPGEVLVRELHIDYWFLVVMSGSVRLSRSGRTVRVLRKGDHFGEVSIVGFRPQTATAVAAVPTVLFVLGRRYLLSLAAMDRSIQRVLFPTIEAGGYRAFVRNLQAMGRADWDEISARGPRPPAQKSMWGRSAGRRLSWAEAIERLTPERIGAGTTVDLPLPSTVARLSARMRLAVAAAAVAVVVLTASMYHPPLAVITPGSAVDVSEDISISGARTYPVHGRYLLTPVHLERPSLGRAVVDALRGREVVRTNTDETDVDPASVQLAWHEALLGSHRQAIELAERTFGTDTERVEIQIRDRGILGPSGGLIYALAIVDLLGAEDLAAGRVVAATGELMRNGKIAPVGFVDVKTQAAAAGDAQVFLVPRAQVGGTRPTGLTVHGVTSLADAIRFLERAS